jgi:hypothetical protein
VRTRDEVDFEFGRRRTQARRCSEPDCDRATREAKPYCTEHVRNHAYVQELVRELAAQQAEETRVRRHGARAVDLEGITAQELVGHLREHGSASIPRLARDLGLGPRVVAAYVRALERREVISTRHNQRGVTVVDLRESCQAA